MADDPVNAARYQFLLRQALEVAGHFASRNISPHLLESHELRAVEILECERSESKARELDNAQGPLQPERRNPELMVRDLRNEMERDKNGKKTDGIV